MSIGDWFKKLFSAPARTDNPVPTDEEVSIDDARIAAGGSGALGIPGEPDSHASPGEEIAEAEADPE